MRRQHAVPILREFVTTPIASGAAPAATVFGTLAVLARLVVASSVLALAVAAFWSFTTHPKSHPGGPTGALKAEAVQVAATASGQETPKSLQLVDIAPAAIGPSTLAFYGAVGLLLGLLAVFALRWQRREVGRRHEPLGIVGARTLDPADQSGDTPRQR